MSTPFDQCAVLEITMSRNTSGLKDSSFKGAGKLLLMVDSHGIAHHFVLPGGIFMSPDEINTTLELIGVTIRVDEQGRPYDPDEGQGDAGEAGCPEGSDSEG